MPYITMMQSPAYHQLTFEEVLFGGNSVPTLINNNTSNTRTKYVPYIPLDYLEKFDIDGMILALKRFCDVHEDLYRANRQDLYDTFPIPKKTGGLRIINAPHPELMNALRELATLLKEKMFALYHTSAFAYVTNRSTIDAIKRHQQNGSKWFLKTDFSDFFGSTTLEFVMYMLSMIFPFCEIVKKEDGRKYLEKAMELCFLNGGLPQGTPISPMITNLMMIPIDHRLYNCLRTYEGVNYVYTRYADDILISSRRSFDHEHIVELITKTLTEFKAPFKIKDEKTRYGSSAGSNWNLGLMLNKDNEITIGHKNKRRLRAMICNYILDKVNKNGWPLHDVQVLRGHINYYKMVEEEYVNEVIAYNNKKFGVNVMKMINADLAG